MAHNRQYLIPRSGKPCALVFGDTKSAPGSCTKSFVSSRHEFGLRMPYRPAAIVAVSALNRASYSGKRLLHQNSLASAG